MVSSRPATATVKATPDAVRHPADYGQALAPEDLGQRRADLGLGLGQQTTARDQRHRHPGAGEHLGQFAADKAAPDDEKRGGQTLHLHRRGAGQDGDIVDAWNHGESGGAAGGDDDLFGRQHLAVHRHAATGQSRRAVAIGNQGIGAQQVLVFGAAQVGHQVVLLGDDGAPVHHRGGAAEAVEAPRSPCLVQGLGRADQSL